MDRKWCPACRRTNALVRVRHGTKLMLACRNCPYETSDEGDPEREICENCECEKRMMIHKPGCCDFVPSGRWHQHTHLECDVCKPATTVRTGLFE